MLSNYINSVELLYLQIFKSCKVDKGLTWYVAYQVILQKSVKENKINCTLE